MTLLHKVNIKFDDAATWANLETSEISHAALYADGEFQVPKSAMPKILQEIPFRRWITVTGNTPHAGLADFEPFNPVYDEPGKLRWWAFNRLTEYRSVPIVYSDRVDVASALRELGALPRYHWIATGNQPAPSGDGTNWTPEELSANLRDEFGVHVPPQVIWANQNRWLGTIDVSNLFLSWWV